MVTIDSTLRKHDGENFHKINDQETQSESPLETGKEWEEKRAIQSPDFEDSEKALKEVRRNSE
ncbi:hypothetical protein T4B_3198 [Trichinella pseudospiralis]|uniref:Uncharacterized protein n=1 Tax=Trichinella pseudospiralis TaxID=6337 RepID=A0A0V1IKZ5_TRIPS|nr:hypothetical protein T4B_3198 [Trichinella pseudospiralis]